MKFIVDKSYWELFPDSKLGVLLLKNMENGESTDEIKLALKEANNEAKKYLVKEVLSENPVIAIWREAYKKFKTKKGVRCSIEALLKRVNSGNHVSSINKLVDIYNSASLKYALPCGAEDLDSFVGDLKLIITQGGDKFIPLGSDEEDNTLPNETKNSFLIMELLDNRLEELNSALDDISENAKKYLNADVEKYILDIENPEITLK